MIIDESWDLLRGGPTASFIEAGYRRARKYDGSLHVGKPGDDDYFNKHSKPLQLRSRTPTGY